MMGALRCGIRKRSVVLRIESTHPDFDAAAEIDGFIGMFSSAESSILSLRVQVPAG
jgi:hypothetical protein